jgi:hypothetical protein
MSYSQNEESRSALKILTRERPLGRPSRRWERNIRMVPVREIGLIRLGIAIDY